MNFMNKQLVRLLVVILVGIGVLFLISSINLPAQASPEYQFTPYPTPTAGPDGRIIYIAQKNDSWWRIAAIFGLNLNKLLELNDATSDTIVTEGMEILLGTGGPAEVTPTRGPSPTPTVLMPTDTPQPGAGTLCTLIFEDKNGDATRQDGEDSIPGGAISVSDRTGKVSFTETSTTGVDPLCFKDLPEDDYNISVAVPDGYNPTTVLNYALTIQPGAETYIDFGAQLSSVGASEESSTSGSNRSLLFGLFGGLLLLGGVLLGVYAILVGRTRRSESP